MPIRLPYKGPIPWYILPIYWIPLGVTREFHGSAGTSIFLWHFPRSPISVEVPGTVLPGTPQKRDSHPIHYKFHRTPKYIDTYFIHFHCLNFNTISYSCNLSLSKEPVNLRDFKLHYNAVKSSEQNLIACQSKNWTLYSGRRLET